MIAVPTGVRVVVARRPVDFRNGLDGLAALVQQALRENPFAGDLLCSAPSGRTGSRSWLGTARVCACSTSVWRTAALSGRQYRTERFASVRRSLGCCWRGWIGRGCGPGQ